MSMSMSMSTLSTLSIRLISLRGIRVMSHHNKPSFNENEIMRPKHLFRYNLKQAMLQLRRHELKLIMLEQEIKQSKQETSRGFDRVQALNDLLYNKEKQFEKIRASEYEK